MDITELIVALKNRAEQVFDKIEQDPDLVKDKVVLAHMNQLLVLFAKMNNVIDSA